LHVNGVPGRVLTPACYRPVEAGMDVHTSATSPRVAEAVRIVAELLMSDHAAPCARHQQNHDCELEVLAERVGVSASSVRFSKPAEKRPHDDSSLVIAVDHSACILCDRCVRACNEVRNNQVIGRMAKGYKAQIAFDLATPMGN